MKGWLTTNDCKFMILLGMHGQGLKINAEVRKISLRPVNQNRVKLETKITR